MRIHCISIPKPGQGSVNEDAARASETLLAVSDGAGGGGIYAEKWSTYLINNLLGAPIRSFEEFDQWVDSIWEPFYNDCEKLAKQEGGLVLDKFYDEGSFATIAAMWIEGDKAYWATYGDSVAFCYNKRMGLLAHSFTKLSDFNKAPYLVNYNNELSRDGFRNGTFDVDDDCILFCASDALSHYIIMMYELAHKDLFEKELLEAEQTETKNAVYIETATNMNIPFEEVLRKLMNCQSPYLFERHLKKLLRDKLIALDDYSFCCRY